MTSIVSHVPSEPEFGEPLDRTVRSLSAMGSKSYRTVKPPARTSSISQEKGRTPEAGTETHYRGLRPVLCEGTW